MNQATPFGRPTVPLKIDAVEVPYGSSRPLNEILVHARWRNPTLESSEVAQTVRHDLMAASTLSERMAVLSEHASHVAAKWISGRSDAGSIKVEYEIAGLRSESFPKAIVFLTLELELMGIALLGMDKFQDFSRSLNCSVARGAKDALSLPGSYGQYLWRNKEWENCPVRLYSPEGENIFSGVYRYARASNGNMGRDLFTDEGENLGDEELDDLILKIFPQYWKSYDPFK